MTARNDHELWADYAQRGAKAAQSQAEAMALAKLLRNDPAFHDAKHPNHAIVTQCLRAAIGSQTTYRCVRENLTST